MSKSTGSEKKKSSPLLKNCPYCSTHLLVDATECSNCKKKVGPLNKHGVTEKPTDWKAISACVACWGALFLYFWVLGWGTPTVRLFKKLLIATWHIIIKISFAIWGVFVDFWETIGEILMKLFS